jgi:aspartate-semialdehyde dehydrogenase
MPDRENASARRPAVVLGATGIVGQRFVQRLADHPWFALAAVAASSRSRGRAYRDACRWMVDQQMPAQVREMPIRALRPDIIDVRSPMRPIAFSALPRDVARDVEPQFAAAGYVVCSNASAFRHDPDVPLIIPEVNPQHLVLLETQRAKRGWSGALITNTNCTTAGIAIVLKPLDDAFGVSRVIAATLQAASGAGYPGVPSLDLLDNVVPFIDGEEEKVEIETRRLLGRASNHGIEPADFAVSAHAHRVPVVDGHTVCLSIAFDSAPSLDNVVGALSAFKGPSPVPGLPSAPARPIIVRDEVDRPQPRLDRDAGGGMSVTVGRIRPCRVLDVRLVLVVHNTHRGAAGGSLLNAELLAQSGLIS